MKQIIITTENNYIRAAVLEDNRLVEVLDDTDRESRYFGSIYKGKICNIVPGIQAAFVDIGLDKNAFLYAGDIDRSVSEEEERKFSVNPPRIENVFKEGQEVVVQIIREPVGNKGARVTTSLSLPGRFAVLLPGNRSYLGISRKITDEKERSRLEELGKRVMPQDAGMIIRTLAEGVPEKEFVEDVLRLTELKEELEHKIKDRAIKGMLYSSSDPFSRLLRDTIDDDIEKIIVDDGKTAQYLRKKLKEINCAASEKVWTDLKGRLFERYDISRAIREATEPKVNLLSGGYLVVEETEALVCIDVNSGKYTGKKSLQDTILKVNLEATLEISRQIKLRNLYGIIIVDFIDMEKNEDWEVLLKQLEEYFLRDKVKCNILGRTKLGLVEITRKKEGQTLASRYLTACPQCGGKGRIIKDSGIND